MEDGWREGRGEEEWRKGRGEGRGKEEQKWRKDGGSQMREESGSTWCRCLHAGFMESLRLGFMRGFLL